MIFLIFGSSCLLPIMLLLFEEYGQFFSEGKANVGSRVRPDKSRGLGG